MSRCRIILLAVLAGAVLAGAALFGLRWWELAKRNTREAELQARVHALADEVAILRARIGERDRLDARVKFLEEQLGEAPSEEELVHGR